MRAIGKTIGGIMDQRGCYPPERRLQTILHPRRGAKSANWRSWATTRQADLRLTPVGSGMAIATLTP